MQQAEETLSAVRGQFQRATEIARRKAAAGVLRRRMQQRRDEIMRKYEGCADEVCRAARDREFRDMYRQNGRNLSAESTGSFRNPDGSPAPPGEGMFVPNPNDRTGGDLADALDAHGALGEINTVTRIATRAEDIGTIPVMGRRCSMLIRIFTVRCRIASTLRSTNRLNSNDIRYEVTYV